MFDINIEFEDIKISSIVMEDILDVQMWINLQNDMCNLNSKPLNFSEFKERFLEYYISECEFFLKIEKKNVLMGIMKGRLEFKNSVEAWILYFSIDNNEIKLGSGTKILNNFIYCLKQRYGIYSFYTCVSEKEKDSVYFWSKNKFKLIRVSKDFYSMDEENINMLVMNLENY